MNRYTARHDADALLPLREDEAASSPLPTQRGKPAVETTAEAQRDSGGD